MSHIRTKATTLQDIARDVGVSTMTVSVVLNGARSATRVSDATRARIKEAAVRMKYLPNAVARGLTRRRMDTIGVVAGIWGGDVNLYFLELFGSIIEAANDYAQNTTIFSVKDWHADERRILQFCDGRVDGMIFLAPLGISAEVADAVRQRTPFVMIHSDINAANVDSAGVDDVGASRELVRYLVSLGHRRIAHFGGEIYRPSAENRAAGYRLALEEAGIDFDESLVFRGRYEGRFGRLFAQEMLDRFPADRLPTAVFCGTDAMAHGCIEVLSASGLRVPDDISIVGIDGLMLSLLTVPPLTTIKQPLLEMGRYAVDRLMMRIREANPELPPIADAGPDAFAAAVDSRRLASPHPAAANAPAGPHVEIFPYELVVRASTGPPRTGPPPNRTAH